MSSCGLYNKYERPDNIDTKGIIRDAVSNTDTLAVNDTTSFGNLPWQSVFTDPQLQALIQQALEKNVDLQNAALSVKMIESTLLISKLLLLSTLRVLSRRGMAPRLLRLISCQWLQAGVSTSSAICFL